MKLTTISLLLLFPALAFAEQKSDTTIVYNGHTITITDESLNDSTTATGNTTYETDYDEWTISETFSFPIFSLTKNSQNASGSASKNAKPKFRSRISGFHVGFTKALNTPDDFDNNMGRSVELGFNCISHNHAFNKHFAISTALGFNWRNYKIDDNKWMQKNGGYISISNLPEGAQLDYSKLRVFGFNIPFVIEYAQKKNGGFHAYLGPQADIRVARRLVNIYTDADGNHHKNTKKHVRTLPFGCDLVGQLGYGKIALYGKYSFTRLFEDGRGPVNKAVTVGVKWIFH